MDNSECIFCKIIRGEIPSDKVHEDENIIAFRDINPVAPTHILIVPKKHIEDNNDFNPEDEALAGKMFSLVRELTIKENIAESGYRLIMNTGKDGRQEVPHMHLHLIGGQRMKHKIG